MNRIGPDNEIVTTRTVNAPRPLVFRAWTEPVHLARWWGPKGFTNTFHTFDLRPGGKWIFTMHGPEKGNYQNNCTFTLIEEPFHVAWERVSQPLFNVDVTFEEVSANQTRVIFRMIFRTPEECAKLKKFVPGKNEENMDKLEVELDRMMKAR